MKDIIDAAYSSRDLAAATEDSASAGGTASGQKFAEELFATCMRRGGNMDPVLGQRL